MDRAIWYLIKKAEGDLPNWSAPTPGNPVTISESLSKKSGFTAEIYCISAPGGGGASQLPPRSTPNSWYIHPASANLPRPKHNSSAVTIGGKVFMFGGSTNPTKSTNNQGNSDRKDDINYWGYVADTYSDSNMLVYDPTTDRWTELGNNPHGAKSGFAAVNYNNKMYMFGRDPNVVVYDPGSNLLSSSDDTWNNIANMQTQLGIERSYTISAVVVKDKIYIVGGYHRFSSNPGSGWGVVTQSGGKWYSYGTVLEFNPATNLFTKINPLVDGRYYGAAGVIKDKIYYVGGIPKIGMEMDTDNGKKVFSTSGAHTRTIWKYDPQADNGKGTVTLGPHMPWLEDDTNTICPEHLAPWGSGDKIQGFGDSLKGLKTHVRDPEYSPYWSNEGYGTDHGIDFSNRPGLAEPEVVVVDDKLFVVGGNNAHLRTYFDGPGYKKGQWYGTYVNDIQGAQEQPNQAIQSKTTGQWTTRRDLFYDYKDGAPYGNYNSYRDWQGQMGSYYRWNKELYVFDGNSWIKANSAPTMDMMTNGSMQGIGINNHTLAAVDGRFYMLGGIGYHFRDPNKQYLNAFVVEGDDTRGGWASPTYINSMYLSVAEFYIRPETQMAGRDGVYKIISTGTETIGFLHKTVSRRIEALVTIKSMTGANGFDGSIICKSGITGVGNAQTDSYDSNKGGYNETTNNGQEGNIFSNGEISLTGNTLVDGDAHCGPEDTISLTGQATVTGNKGAGGQEISLPSITVPGDAINQGQINGNLTLNAGTYTCSGINLNGQDELTINGDVRLYCTGNIQLSGQASINVLNNQSATKFHIYCTDAVTSVDVVGNGEFFGTIYAPCAEIKISGNGNVYGQLIGNEVKFNGNGAVIYDEQLKNTLWWPGPEKKTKKVIYWREVAL